MTSMWPLSRPQPVETGSDAELVRRCLSGDRAAVAELYEQHAGPIARVLQRTLGPVAEIEDLVQTTFVEAMESLERFRGASSLRTWLTRIALHGAHRHLRSGKVRRHVPLELVAEPEEPAIAAEALPGHGLDERRLSARLHGLLDQISPKKRMAFLLFVVEQKPVEEVARLMDATETATRSRVFFARRELRALIEADPALASLTESLLGDVLERSTT